MLAFYLLYPQIGQSEIGFFKIGKRQIHNVKCTSKSTQKLSTFFCRNVLLIRRAGFFFYCIIN